MNNHFKAIYQKGNANEKKQAREYFLKWAKNDKESKEIWDELKPKATVGDSPGGLPKDLYVFKKDQEPEKAN